MPIVDISEGLGRSLKLVDLLFDTVFTTGVVTSSSPTEVRLTVGSFSAVITGTGLQLGTDPGDPPLIAGTLTGLVHTYRPGYVVTFSDLMIDVADLAAAARAEISGSDIGAFEALLYPLDWEIRSNDVGDRFERGELSYDGVPIEYTGDNLVWLEFGYDAFFGGLGDDTIYGGGRPDEIIGGRGDDWLEGQQDKDRIQGNAGHDTLLGGISDDTLSGGTGNDLLDGGRRDDVLKGREDQDTLIGGLGNDTLFGGSEGDEFRFVTDGQSELDLIRDFEIGIDTVTIHTDETVTQTDTARGLEIAIGDHIIRLQDVTSTDLAPDSIQVFDLA